MKAVSLERNLRTDAAARQLVAARLARRPGARLAESCRPRDIETALAIRRRVGELLHFDVGGWKCSLPMPDKAVFMAPIYAPTHDDERWLSRRYLSLALRWQLRRDSGRYDAAHELALTANSRR